VGVLVSIVYLIALLTTQPYKRRDHDALAMGTQSMLVLILVAAQTVQLFEELEQRYGGDAPSSVLGFRSLNEVVVVMVIFNASVLIAFTSLILYQFARERSVRALLLERSNELPELTLARKMRYLRFLPYPMGAHPLWDPTPPYGTPPDPMGPHHPQVPSLPLAHMELWPGPSRGDQATAPAAPAGFEHLPYHIWTVLAIYGPCLPYVDRACHRFEHLP